MLPQASSFGSSRKPLADSETRIQRKAVQAAATPLEERTGGERSKAAGSLVPGIYQPSRVRVSRVKLGPQPLPSSDKLIVTHLNSQRTPFQ